MTLQTVFDNRLLNKQHDSFRLFVAHAVRIITFEINQAFYCLFLITSSDISTRDNISPTHHQALRNKLKLGVKYLCRYSEKRI